MVAWRYKENTVIGKSIKGSIPPSSVLPPTLFPCSAIVIMTNTKEIKNVLLNMEVKCLINTEC